MMLRVRCQCGKVLKLTDYSVGKAIPCPNCGTRIRIAPRNHASIEPLEEVQPPTPAAPVEEELYDFVPNELPAVRVPVVPAAPPAPVNDGPPCPFCHGPLLPGARICIHCGVDLTTGRPVHEMEARMERIVAAVSWFVPAGAFPITPTDPATRAGTLATWLIAAATILLSVIFFVYLRTEPQPEPVVLNLQLWTGSAQASEQRNARLIGVMERRITRQARESDPKGAVPPSLARDARRRATTMAAAITGMPEGVGFRLPQLLSHAFVHDTSTVLAFLYHLIGNLLFLLIFGLAVNEVLGSARVLIVYALLAMAAAGLELVLNLREPMHPCVGASGPISGLAGIYVIFFGVQRVQLAAWLRLHRWLEYGTRSIRGIWIVVAWFVYNDLLPAMVEVRAEDVVISHAMHALIFLVGLVLAAGLLGTGQVDLRGDDLISRAFRKLRKKRTSPAD